MTDNSNAMKLDQFISGVLVGISEGIKDAKKETGISLIGITSSDDKGGGDRIDFDVAITVSDQGSRGGQAKGAITVPSIFSASLGGNKENKTLNEQISRVKFSIFMPTG